MNGPFATRGSTTYVATGDTALVASCVLGLLEREGFAAVPPPPPRRPSAFDLAQDADPRAWPVWQIEVAEGAPGWSVVRTWPLEAFTGAAPGESTPRAAALAKLAGARVLAFTYFGTTRASATEASPDGALTTTPGFLSAGGRPRDVAIALATRCARDPAFADAPLLANDIERARPSIKGRRVLWVRREPVRPSARRRSREPLAAPMMCAVCATDASAAARLLAAIEGYGYRCRIARCAASAWTLAAAPSTGAVVLGSLARIDAVRIATRLREERAGSAPSILACVAWDGRDHVASFRAPRVDAYLPMPPDAETLSLALRRAAVFARIRAGVQA